MRFQTLRSEQDFVRFRKSKSFYSPSFRVRVISANQSVPRFGFIVPKKVLAKVVDRNKIKRRLKGIIHANTVNIKPADVLIMPSRESLKKKYSELESELIKLLKQSNLWKS